MSVEAALQIVLNQKTGAKTAAAFAEFESGRGVLCEYMLRVREGFGDEDDAPGRKGWAYLFEE